MKHVEFTQPFELFIGYLPWSRYHEPAGGNGFQHYPAMLMATFNQSKEFVSADIQDIPGLEPQTTEGEAKLLAKNWLRDRHLAALEANCRWLMD